MSHYARNVQTEQRRCEQCSDYADYCEAAGEYRCDGCWLSAEQAETERHDTFLQKLVDDEYWHAVRGAKAIFDHEVGVATDKFGAGSADLAAAFAAADRKFTDVIVAARAAKPVRLAQLRANDVSEAA